MRSPPDATSRQPVQLTQLALGSPEYLIYSSLRHVKQSAPPFPTYGQLSLPPYDTSSGIKSLHVRSTPCPFIPSPCAVIYMSCITYHCCTPSLHNHPHVLSSATNNPDTHLLPTPAPCSSRPDTAATIYIYSDVLQSCMSCCCTHSHAGAGLTVLPVLRQARGDPVSRRAPILRGHPELPRGHHVVVAQRPAPGKPVSCSPRLIVTSQGPAAGGSCGLLHMSRCEATQQAEI